MNFFPINLAAFRKLLSSLENRQFTQANLADLLFSSSRQIVRWEHPDYHPSPKQVALFADAVNRYFAKAGLVVTGEDVLREDFIVWLRGQIGAALRKINEGTEADTYSSRSLARLLAQTTLCEMLQLDDIARKFLTEKLQVYRSDLTEQDWLAIFQLHLRGELEAEEWKFKDPEVVTARLHFKSPRPLTAKELQVAERAAWDAVRAYQLQEQAKRKKETE